MPFARKAAATRDQEGGREGGREELLYVNYGLFAEVPHGTTLEPLSRCGDVTPVSLRILGDVTPVSAFRSERTGASKHNTNPSPIGVFYST